MKTIHIVKTILALLLALAVVLAVSLSCNRNEKKGITIGRIAPDTVRVEKVKLVYVDRPVYPGRVWLQEKIDSALVIELANREREVIGVEKKTENKLFKKDKTYLNIQTIDKNTGVIMQQEHEILPGESFKIDANGFVQLSEEDRKKAKRKENGRKVWRTVKTAGVFVVGAVAGAFIFP